MRTKKLIQHLKSMLIYAEDNSALQNYDGRYKKAVDEIIQRLRERDDLKKSLKEAYDVLQIVVALNDETN